jgi:thaumarchaeosortase
MRLNKEILKKHWLHVTLIVCLAAAIFFLVYLDYFNLEKIGFFNNAGFLFQITWKGRMFLLFFLGLFMIETVAGFKWLKEAEIRHRRKSRTAAAIICALVPLAYIIVVNYLGFGQIVIGAGEAIRLDYWKTSNPLNWPNSVNIDWPLSLEYVVFTVSFVATVLLAYGKRGVKAFCLTAALVAGVSIVYMIDTMYPFGAFTPFQIFVLPTSACAAGLMQAMGFHFTMMYSPGYGPTPLISVNANGASSAAGVAWPCAGVHSLVLYAVFTLLLFTKINISAFRKSIYFVVGLAGTFVINAFRIVGYFVVLVGQGQDSALIFHNIYGEIFFYTWMLLFALLIMSIQRFSLVDKVRTRFLRNKPSISYDLNNSQMQ